MPSRPRLDPLAVDGDRPLRSVLRLLGHHRRQVLVAVAFFAVKDVPLWLMPVVTGKVIDVLVAGGPLRELWTWAAVAVVTLLQNYPNHVQYTKRYMGAVRQIGADLRNGLTARLQSMSIGFHSRTSASIVQTKVVRDVENVELMLQQVAHPLLSATMVVTGAVVMTALAVPQFLPVYALTIPLAVVLRYVLGLRSREYNATFRREVEHFSARVGEMATLMPITRAHGLERTARERSPPVRRACGRPGSRSTCSTGASRPCPGSACSCWGSCASCSPRGSRSRGSWRSRPARSCRSRRTSPCSPAR
ncbi:hypothetical protein Cma02nite_27210 [Cellulomonas marina]|nr:hypothetical protein Cma02nite_27210 [Cellulomonas marina]